ncbi:dUTP diphosphatase [Candidatus Peregrinibacteria bacterium]|nr:dUTP diphosphatase [Candidatus Peregrinibacteria bacterium]
MKKVYIKRIDKDLPLPKYHTDGSVAFDLLARETTSIKKGDIALIPGNVIVKVPNGYMLTVVPRSSTPRKKGLLIPHGIGVIDQDYHGPEDEVLIQVLNFTDAEVIVEKGERIAQAVLVRIDKFEFEEVDDDIIKISRGGLGSTG